ncbi:unnamed protein product [Caenorhabditis sp. 36 PRJEB53466]|nr:unnamed protein product [Caenorhabditis sp. 36 PRJEB53466]
MRAILLLMAILAIGLAELLPTQPDQKQDNASVESTEDDDLPDHPFQEFDALLSQRGYAYVTAVMIMVMFAAVVYCHVVSVRKTRLLEQYAQQGRLPEWSPLLIDRKNIRPPPPYEQVV